MNPHEANRAFCDASTMWWKEKEDKRGLWMKAHKDPSLVLSPAELPFLKDVAGKDVCVLGSGDNEVTFALAGIGARVTSVDIRTVSDHIQAVVDAGCRIVKVDEHGERIEDEYWTKASLDKFPAYLMIVGRKDSPKMYGRESSDPSHLG